MRKEKNKSRGSKHNSKPNKRRRLEEEKLAHRISEESLLPKGLNQQIRDEYLLHPEGREYVGLSPVGVACPGPTMLDEKLADRISTKRKENEDNLLPGKMEAADWR